MERAIYLSNKLGAVVYCSALSPDPICSLRPQEGIKGKLRRPETTSVSSKVYLSIFTFVCWSAPNAMNRLKLTSSLRSRQSPNISVWNNWIARKWGAVVVIWLKFSISHFTWGSAVWLLFLWWWWRKRRRAWLCKFVGHCRYKFMFPIVDRTHKSRAPNQISLNQQLLSDLSLQSSSITGKIHLLAIYPLCTMMRTMMVTVYNI